VINLAEKKNPVAGSFHLRENSVQQLKLSRGPEIVHNSYEKFKKIPTHYSNSDSDTIQ
jgi:hypothetical protein